MFDTEAVVKHLLGGFYWVGSKTPVGVEIGNATSESWLSRG